MITDPRSSLTEMKSSRTESSFPAEMPLIKLTEAANLQSPVIAFVHGLISTTTTSHVHHTFLYISFPFLHDYDVIMSNISFYGGRKQATTKFISLSELEFGPLKFSLRRVRLQLTK